MTVTSMELPGAEVAVIALTVVCVTLVILPPLNHQLVLLQKSHAHLTAYDNMSRSQQTDIVRQVKTPDPLTVREQEVLQLILSGKSNREIVSTEGSLSQADTEETVVSTFGMLIGSRIYRWGLDGVPGARLRAVQIDQERMILTFGDKGSDHAGRVVARDTKPSHG
jgi:hypothetical protein